MTRIGAMTHVLARLVQASVFVSLVVGTAPPVLAAPSARRVDGTITVGGKPFYPLGVYYNGRSHSASARATHLQQIAEAGFNAVEASQLEIWADRDPFLAEAARLGLSVMPEINPDGAAGLNLVTSLRNHPTIFAWDVADDAHRRFTVEAFRARRDAVRARDPEHLTFSSAYDPQVWGPYMGITDVVGCYRYPIYGDANAVGAVDVAMTQALRYRTANSLWGLPQAYRWSGTGNRFPTAIEYRNMTYQHVINGVKGLFPYSFTDSGLLPSAAPELWREMGVVNRELAAFLPALLEGNWTKRSTGTAGLLAAEWIHAGSRIVVVVNTASAGRPLSLPLEGTIEGAARGLFSGRSTTLTVQGTRLSGTVAALDVQAVVLGGSPVQPSPDAGTGPDAATVADVRAVADGDPAAGRDAGAPSGNGGDAAATSGMPDTAAGVSGDAAGPAPGGPGRADAAPRGGDPGEPQRAQSSSGCAAAGAPVTGQGVWPALLFLLALGAVTRRHG